LNTGEACAFVQSGMLVLTVTDTGKGMTAEQVRNLFGEGVQYNRNKLQAGGGSGLGLFIAKGIVEQHRGTLTVASEGIGCGTTFTLRLPLYYIPDALLPPGYESLSRSGKQSSNDGGGGSGKEDFESMAIMEKGTMSSKLRAGALARRPSVVANRPLRILVVDDAASNRKMLLRTLRNKHHTCVEAHHGQDAVDKFTAARDENNADADSYGDEPFDTILMDYEMPVMDGPSASKLLRAMGCECLIVGVTGNILIEDVKHFHNCGADEVLAKPLKIAELERCWRKHGLAHTAGASAMDQVTAAATAVTALYAANNNKSNDSGDGKDEPAGMMAADVPTQRRVGGEYALVTAVDS